MKKTFITFCLGLLFFGTAMAQPDFQVTSVTVSSDSLQTTAIDTVKSGKSYFFKVGFICNLSIKTPDTIRFNYSSNGVISDSQYVHRPPVFIPANTPTEVKVPQRVDFTGTANIDFCVWKTRWCCTVGGLPQGDVNAANDTMCKSLVMYRDISNVAGLEQYSAVGISATSNRLQVTSFSQSTSNYHLEVFDITGRKVADHHWESFGSQVQNIEFHQPAGYYIARIYDAGLMVLNKKVFVK
ncbi:MAG: hypothetical protein KDC37_07035 [Flavobacteriales bacterium]|nr:hypothetical protein [Flavobacteriales bacterium]